MYYLKLTIAVLIDLFDFTVGRLMFATPFASEIFSTALCYLMFGPRALWAAIELLDPTEQVDAMIPVATLIALSVRDEQLRSS